jgi:deoxyribonuclease-4
MKIGSHVSNKGAEMLLGAVREAMSYEANCLMIYLGPPQNSYRKPLSRLRADEARRLAAEGNIDFADVVIHAPYILNLAQEDGSHRRFAIDYMVSEIIDAGIIGAKNYVFHPGNRLKLSVEEGIDNIARALREIIERTEESGVDLAVETMSGKGTEAGKSFKELALLIKAVDSPRLKICFDTCHAHDAGYDIVSGYEETIALFDCEIGLDRLAVIHVNDSKNERGARKDRHENIGYGKIGFDALYRIASDPRFSDRPKILETPYVKTENREVPPYREEIAMLRRGRFHDFIEELKKG